MSENQESKSKIKSVKYKPVHRKSMELARIYNFISPQDLEEILETLADWNCLNSRGKELKQNFWNEFIKD